MLDVLGDPGYDSGSHYHCVKSVRIRSFSGPHFPIFVLNAEIYSVNFCIQCECEKTRTRKTPNMDTFCAAYSSIDIFRRYFTFELNLKLGWYCCQDFSKNPMSTGRFEREPSTCDADN